MSKNKKIALIGEAMIELRGNASDKASSSVEQFYGGDVLNTSVYIARLNEILKQHNNGLDIFFATAMGQDTISEKFIHCWQEEGIDTSLVLRNPNKLPGVYWIQLDNKGERSFLYWRNDSAARYLFQDKEIVTWKESLSSMDMIFISGISIAILADEDKQQCIEMLQALAASGCKIIFDTNYRARLWQSPEQAKQYCAEVFKLAYLVLATEDDEQQLWQDKDVESMLSRIKELGAENIIIKQGANGCTLVQQNSAAVQIPTEQVINVVDTTAAGDAFNAGCLAALVKGESLLKACESANRLAGYVIQYPGAIVDRNESNKFLNNIF